MKRWKVTGRILAVTVAACLLCCTAAQAKGPKGPSYQIVRLDTDDGSGGVLSGEARDINSSTFIVGNVSDTDGTPEAVCWTVTNESGSLESEMHYLDQFPFDKSDARGCNESGEIVGNMDGGLAVYWAGKDSSMELLPAPLARSNAKEINASGVICGTSWVGEGEHKALVWSFTETGWQYLALPHQGDPLQDEYSNTLRNISFANAISDEQDDTGLITVVGFSNGNAAAWTVTLGADGRLVEIEELALIPDAPYSEATGVNNAGMICGSMVPDPGYVGTGVVWVDGGLAEPLMPVSLRRVTRQVSPHDVNDSGLIVGYAFNQAALFPNKKAPPILLDDFLPKRNAPFYSLSNAHAVNKWGEIVGRGQGTLSESPSNPPFLAIPE